MVRCLDRILSRTHAFCAAAVTIGSGVQWGDLYREVDAQNRSIAGGFSDRGTVGAGGGWPLGGGHSVLSPLFGLGNPGSFCLPLSLT